MASPTSVFRAGATALITGSASGVGLAVAKLCASHSMNLILVDNNTSALLLSQVHNLFVVVEGERGDALDGRGLPIRLDEVEGECG